MTSFIMAGKILPILCLASTIIAQGLKPLVYEGCFTSAGDMTNAGSNQYQTPGLCQQQCVNLNKAVMGTHNGADCYCGDLLPSASDKTSEGSCNVKCNGYGTIMCGASNAWSVQLTGTNSNPGSVDSSSSGGSSGASNSNSNSNANANGNSGSGTSSQGSETKIVSTPTASPVTTANSQPSGVTPSTIVVTAPGQTQPTTTVVTTTEVPQKSRINVAGVAAGVVVGVVALTALAGGLFFFLRSRRRRAVEEEHRNSMGAAWYGQKRRSSSSNSISDSRLEPSVMMQRRQSDGSIADNQDYSRRILKVTNPDGS